MGEEKSMVKKSQLLVGPVKFKLGTESIPLKLTPHGGDSYSEYLDDQADFSSQRRNLIDEYVNLPHEGGTYLNFYKIKKEVPDSFVKNVITNPHLDSLEIRLAIYLHRYFQTHPQGNVFFLPEQLSVDDLSKDISEDGLLYYGFPNETQPFFILDFAVYISNIFYELNLEYDECLARQAILKLHNFSYITVTEVCWRNTLKRATRNFEKLPINKKVNALIIQLYPMMDERDISQYWKPKVVD
jgi:hypothetical protein